MDLNLLIQGAELMLLGMGIVFAFLTILVVTLRGMSSLAARLDDGQGDVADVSVPIDVSNDQPPVAVITAAIARYRASRAA